VLTDAQLKDPGPLQPAGSVAKLPDIPNPEMVLPSLDVNVTLTVCFAPTATDTPPATDTVATIELFEPVGLGVPPTGLPVGLPPVLPPPPAVVSMVPLLLL
jgi:hypothetical protein